MIKREHYIEKIRKFYDSEKIKLITGIKNSGKSTLLAQIMSEIKEKTDNVIALNFGDKRVCASIKSSDALVLYVEERAKRGKCYLFFDEMQTLVGWEKACAELQARGYSLFVVGSDRDPLTEDFKREVGEKYVSFQVRPFVYKEILEYAEQLGKSVDVDDYIVFGGFPKRFELDSNEEQRRYLYELDGAIIDGVIRRYKIRKEDLFKSLVDFVLQSNGRVFSEKAIHDRIAAEHGSCSINTIMKYLDYLKEAYVIESAQTYSSRVERALVFYSKLYNTDVSFNSNRCLDERFDMAHDLENTVYNELIYMGYEVSYYDNGGRTIDIFAKKGDEEYFIQTAYGEEKSESEIAEAFSGLGASAKKILISYGADVLVKGVTSVSFEDFLAMESLSEVEIVIDNENFKSAEKTEIKRTVKAESKKRTRTENFAKKEKASEESKTEEKKPEEKKKKVPFYQIF